MEANSCSFPRCCESRKSFKSAKYEDVRAESMHCSKHACRTLEGYPNAVPCRNVALPGTKYCDIHPSCTLKSCNYQRSPTKPFCQIHTCAVENCRNPASSPNRRCEVHMSCPFQGCTRFLHKRPDGQGWYAACINHVSKRCDLASCPARVRLTDTYCANHICAVRDCPEQRVSDGGNCQSHICAVNKCRLPVANPHQVRPNHRMRAYCLVHECKTTGCHAVTAVAHGHCTTHGCRVGGCNNAKSPDESLDGYCFSHISANVYRKAEQAGRNAEINEARKRREEEMEQQRKQKIIQKEHEERMRREEEIESLRRENERLRAENASVADHNQHYDWDSAESPRSSSFWSDYPHDNSSYQQRTGGDHTCNTPRSQFYDYDSDTAVAGSTDDIPIQTRPAAPYRYVYRRRGDESDAEDIPARARPAAPYRYVYRRHGDESDTEDIPARLRPAAPYRFVFRRAGHRGNE